MNKSLNFKIKEEKNIYKGKKEICILQTQNTYFLVGDSLCQK